MSRRKFIPLAYGFFIVVFVLFFIAMRSRPEAEQIWIGRGFFVWVSVFNLFNTAVFWAFMTDLFTVEQGKRLYGFIAVGGTLGAILGAYITKYYVREIGPANLLVIAAAMFAIAGFLVRFFPHGFAKQHKSRCCDTRRTNRRIGLGGHHPHLPLALPHGACRKHSALYDDFDLGVFSTERSCAWSAKDQHRAHGFFETLEIWVNSITVLIQIFLTGRLLKWFGVAFTLVSLPFLSMVGFAAMGIAASLAMLAVFQVARRAAAYALMRPSREILLPC